MKHTHRILTIALAAALLGATVVSCNDNDTSLGFWVKYAVEATTDGNGTVTAAPAAAERGETVTLTATPDEGYIFAGWTVGGDRTAQELGLSGEFDNPATFTMPDDPVAVSARFEPVRSTEGALWHEGTGTWIVPQADPYALDNVRAAAANLAARGVTRAETVAATHYALKIFPRTEDEQWELERTEGVTLSYIPFDRLALTDAQATAGEQNGELGDRQSALFSEPGANDYPEAEETTTLGDPVPDNASPDDIPESEGRPEELPVLYAVWPVDKALPDGFDYTTDYEVWLPAAAEQTRGAAMDAETARALEDEAIRLALGDATAARAATRAGGATRAGVTLSGQFWVWEALRTVQGPVPYIKVKFYLGSNIVETTTDEEGYFSVTADAVPAAASWDIVFQTSEWKLTRNTSTVPKFFVQGDVYQSNYWSGTDTDIRTTIQTFDAALIKALGYYYYTDHNLSRWTVPDGIRVIAHSNSSGSYNGLFTYSSAGCYITIYRNNTSNVNLLMGTIFHELGHFIHFKERGGYSGMKNTDRFIQESFASYSGWYLTEKYYRELGYDKENPGQDISGQARQTWRSTTSGDWGYYSPLFIDLVDDYNQSNYYPACNDDKGKGTHYGTIMRIIEESADWESCKAVLRDGNDLVDQPLDAFLAPYEYWYGNR